MQHTKVFASFYHHFVENFIFKKVFRVVNLVVLQNYPRSLENVPCTLFIITCNQKLGCGCNLFISRIFFI